MAATTAAPQQDILPNETLYVSYVYDKLHKDTTKHLLYALFSQFGRVIDVVYSKPLRGRAWVVYEDVRMATSAKLNLDGFEVYGKGIRVSYARTKSDAVAKRDGSWKPDGRTRQVRYDEIGAGGAGGATMATTTAGSRGAGGAETSSGDVDVGAPNTTLFVEGLPEGTKEEMLSVLFGQFPGYTGGRMVPGKVGMAFVDFKDAGSAGIALQGLQGFQIGVGSVLRLTYAKA